MAVSRLARLLRPELEPPLPPPPLPPTAALAPSPCPAMATLRRDSPFLSLYIPHTKTHTLLLSLHLNSPAASCEPFFLPSPIKLAHLSKKRTFSRDDLANILDRFLFASLHSSPLSLSLSLSLVDTLWLAGNGMNKRMSKREGERIGDESMKWRSAGLGGSSGPNGAGAGQIAHWLAKFPARQRLLTAAMRGSNLNSFDPNVLLIHDP